jgi:hypothetical protein
MIVDRGMALFRRWVGVGEFERAGVITGSCTVLDSFSEMRATATSMEAHWTWLSHLPNARLGVNAVGLLQIVYALSDGKVADPSAPDIQADDVAKINRALVRLEKAPDQIDHHRYRAFRPYFNILMGYALRYADQVINLRTTEEIERERKSFTRIWFGYSGPTLWEWMNCVTNTLNSYAGHLRYGALKPRDVWLQVELLTYIIYVDCTTATLTEHLKQYLRTCLESGEQPHAADLKTTKALAQALNDYAGRGDGATPSRSSDAAETLAQPIIEHLRAVCESIERLEALTTSISQRLSLSWEAAQFDTWHDWREDLTETYKLVMRSTLALWTEPPFGDIWAPQDAPAPVHTDTPSAQSSGLQTDAVATFDILLAARRCLLRVKDAHGVPITTPRLFKQVGRERVALPPTFYVAVPAMPAIDPMAYARRASAYIYVHHLIRTYLHIDELSAEGLSWSILEGDLVTVRGEPGDGDLYKARYLLIPASVPKAVPVTAAEIDADVYQISSMLTYLECSIAQAAETLSRQIIDLAERRAKDASTMQSIDEQVRIVTRVIPALPSPALDTAEDEFVKLQLILGRVRYSLRSMDAYATQLQQEYLRQLDSIEASFRRWLTVAPLPGPGLNKLSTSLADAYPMHNLREPVRRLQVYTEQLGDTIQSITILFDLLNSALASSERRRRERRDRRSQKLGLAFALVAALIAVPTYVDEARLVNLYGWFIVHTNLGAACSIECYEQVTFDINFVFLIASVVIFIWFVAPSVVRKAREVVRYVRGESDTFRRDVRLMWEYADGAAVMLHRLRRRGTGEHDKSLFSAPLSLPRHEHAPPHGSYIYGTAARDSFPDQEPEPPLPRQLYSHSSIMESATRRRRDIIL